MTIRKSYKVWDANVRWFHWINLLCLIGLIAVGVVILNGKALGITTEAKIFLKTVHVWIGYVFTINLFWRLIWAFVGGDHSRWRAILPGRSGYCNELKDYAASIKAGQPKQYLGHNPIGRIAVSILLFLLLVQAVTGLVLAGTDIFYPPFGGWIAEWIAAPGVDPKNLQPYAKLMFDETAYEAMRAFRKPFISIHYYGFYTLIAFAVLHIAAVVLSEVREDTNLISSMFSGNKVLSEEPVDKIKK